MQLVGRTSGKGLTESLCILFQGNEVLPEEQRLTDTDILGYIEDEFGSRGEFFQIGKYRYKYNQGNLTGGKVPKKKSRAYNRRGQAIRQRAHRAKKMHMDRH